MTRLRLAAKPIIASGFCTVFLMYQALSPAVSSPVASPVAGPEIKALHCAVIGQGHCLQSSYMNPVSHRQPGQLALWKLGDFEMDADGKTLQERFKVLPRLPEGAHDWHEARVLDGDFGKWEQFKLASQRHHWWLAVKTAWSVRWVRAAVAIGVAHHF